MLECQALFSYFPIRGIRVLTRIREMVVSDLISLRNDVDVCNDMYPHKPQTQLELGFHEDVEERLLINSGRIKTASNAQKQPTSQFHDAVPV